MYIEDSSGRGRTIRTARLSTSHILFTLVATLREENAHISYHASLKLLGCLCEVGISEPRFTKHGGAWTMG